MKHLVLLGTISTLLCQDLILVETPEEDHDEASVASVEERPVSTAEVFVPTDDWQEVMPGQQIPGGLHVRLNIQTGKKEAKILREEKKEDISPDTLKEALKNIKADFKHSESSSESHAQDFRSMEELKAALGDVDLNVETDIEIVKKLFKKFEASVSDEDKAVILEDLEYYTHQYDNALLFVELGGIRDILLPSLNSSSLAVRLEACLLVSGAAQSNPQFQISSLESGLLDTLLRLTILQPHPLLASRAFSGLSSLLRNFPQAQNKFLRDGGLGLLVRLFQNEGKAHEKLKIKILTLVHDLLVERETSLLMTDEASLRRREQYSAEDLESQIEKFGFCQVFSQVLVLPKSDRQAKREDILSTISEEFPLRAEHDIIEKILDAMKRMRTVCGKEISADLHLRQKLIFLQAEYQVLSEKEQAEPGNDDLYFSSLLNTISDILNSSDNIKTEL